MTLEEFWKYVDEKGHRSGPIGKCGHELKIDDLEGNYAGYCADCYYKELGDHLENSLPPHKPIH